VAVNVVLSSFVDDCGRCLAEIAAQLMTEELHEKGNYGEMMNAAGDQSHQFSF